MAMMGEGKRESTRHAELDDAELTELRAQLDGVRPLDLVSDPGHIVHAPGRPLHNLKNEKKRRISPAPKRSTSPHSATSTSVAVRGSSRSTMATRRSTWA